MCETSERTTEATGTEVWSGAEQTVVDEAIDEWRWRSVSVPI